MFKKIQIRFKKKLRSDLDLWKRFSGWFKKKLRTDSDLCLQILTIFFSQILTIFFSRILTIFFSRILTIFFLSDFWKKFSDLFEKKLRSNPDLWKKFSDLFEKKLRSALDFLTAFKCSIHIFLKNINIILYNSIVFFV